MAESPAESHVTPQQSPRPQLRSPASNSNSLTNIQTIAQAKAELEARLAGIHNDLQLTQTIGLLFVKREEDLKNCFEQLQQLSEQEERQQQEQVGNNHEPETRNDGELLPETLRDQLSALDKEFQEGENGLAGLKRLIDAQLPADSSSYNDLQTSRSASVLGPSALPSSTLPAQTISRPRRHRVVIPSTPSTNDAAFPLQIQEELLNQVRYWTSQAEMKEKQNQEYDTKINEQERIIDALHKQRRLREESEERQKEDQWNLELQNQELRNQNTELQAQLSKATLENGRIQKAFVTATEQVEQLKDKEEKTASQLEIVKSRFEQDMTAMRKHMAGIQREKSDLLSKVDDLNTTMAIQQQKLSKKATLEAIALAQELEDKELENTAGAPVLIQSPMRTLNSEESTTTTPVAASLAEPKIASLARESSFAHQQSIISELQTKLSKEVTEKEELIAAKEELLIEKEELVMMLADREETIETMRLEGVATFEPDALPKRSSLATLDGMESRHPSEMGLLDDAEAGGRRDLSTLMSESNGQNLPFPTGGLFAELAQATSQSNIKPAAEYKDQEVMTEPIESWIHTVPGLSILANGTSSSERPSETSVIEESPAAEQTDVAPIRGKPGTETKYIVALDSAETSPEVEALDIADVKENETPQETIDEHDPYIGEPVPRSKPTAAVEEERRHTCDLSQTIAGASASAVPPVPEVPKDISIERPTLETPEDREFRVSFGSAFGGDPSATDTGRIRSIYMENGQAEDQRKDAEGSTGESSTMPLAVAGAAAAAGALAASKLGKQRGASSSEDGAMSPVAAEYQSGRQTLGSSQTAAEQEEEEGKKFDSLTPSQEAQGEKKGLNTVAPLEAQQPTRPAPTTVVSVSSRMTYTYNQNSSQVLLPHLNSSTHYHHHHHHTITDSSGASIGRQPNYRGSPNGSISSMSTDYNHGGQYRNGRRMSSSSNYDVTPTDPTMIQLITQTMIGDYLWKFTRRRMASMMSEKSHRRYVWVHPYTKTLYWSMNNPGAEGSREQRAKSAFILAVFQVTDENPSGLNNSDLPNVSILVQTSSRNLKLKAPTREKHELWFQSMSYLLSRPSTPGADIPSDNQTWSEVQANSNVNGNNNNNSHHRGASGSGPAATGVAAPPSNDAVLTLRQNEKANNLLRSKSSLTRLQSMFGRSSLSKEGAANPAPPSSAAIGSPRIGPSGLGSGITTTAAASAAAGHGAGGEKSGLTNNVMADGTLTNGVHGS